MTRTTRSREFGPVGLALLLSALFACMRAPSGEPPSEAEQSARLGATFAATCAHCHVGHVGSDPPAPRAGHPEDWNGRETLDFDQLVARVIDGHGAMPPLGTCSFCSERELRSLVALLVAGSDVEVPADVMSEATGHHGGISP